MPCADSVGSARICVTTNAPLLAPDFSERLTPECFLRAKIAKVSKLVLNS